MPWRVNGSNDFAALLEMLQENLSYNDDVTEVNNGVFKIQNGSQITYWVGDKDAKNVSIIVDTEDNGNFRKVVYTAKNPKISGAPFASDVYMTIKNDAMTDSLVFSSDELISDDAARLWQRLVTHGHNIAVFDTTTHKYELTHVSTAQDLKKYFGDSTKQRFIFVMSESIETIRGTIHSVALMELKRNAGYPLSEIFDQYKKEKINE